MADYERTIDGKFAYEYPAVYMTGDAVVFGFDGWQLFTLLVRRRNEPFQGRWAFPGGFMNVRMEDRENIEGCVRRELLEETGIETEDAYLKQIGTFSDYGRDPRYRVVTTAYYVLVHMDKAQPKANDDAADARWFPLKALPQPLAFDHDRILRVALQRLREDMHFRPVAFYMLADPFTLPQAQRLYEQILETKFDRRNFLSKMNHSGFIHQTGEKEESHTHRGGNYYHFEMKDYVSFKRSGLANTEF